MRSRASRTQSRRSVDDLIVAAAAGVELAADVAQAVDQRLLDVHVDVFELGRGTGSCRLNFLPNVGQGLCKSGWHSARSVSRPTLASIWAWAIEPGDVVRIKAVVEADAFGEPLDAAIRRLIENSTARWTRRTDPFVSRQMMSPAAGEQGKEKRTIPC